MHYKSYFAALACSLVLSVSPQSIAQIKSPDQSGAQAKSAKSVAADALFSQGNALLDAGIVEEACRKFQASQKLDPGVGTLLHLADCHEQAGRFATAWRIFGEASRLAAQRADHDRQRIADVRAAALSPRAPRLHITFKAGVVPPDYQFSLDGETVEPGSLLTERMLDAGPHSIEVSAPGHITTNEKLILLNDAEPVTLKLARLTKIAKPAPPPVTAQYQRPQASAARGWGYLLTTAGVLSLGAGGVLSVLALNEKDRVAGECSGNICQTPAAVNGRSKAKSLADLATVFAVAGAVTSVGGLGLIISSPSGAPPSADSGLSITLQGKF